MLNFYQRLKIAWAMGRADNTELVMLCEELLRKNERDLCALSSLANYYESKRQLDKAIVFAERALELAPNDFDTLRLLANTHNINGNYRETYEYVSRLINAPSPSIRDSTGSLPGVLRLLPKLVGKEQEFGRLVNELDDNEAQWRKWAKEYKEWFEKSQSDPASN